MRWLFLFPARPRTRDLCPEAGARILELPLVCCWNRPLGPPGPPGLRTQNMTSGLCLQDPNNPLVSKHPPSPVQAQLSFWIHAFGLLTPVLPGPAGLPLPPRFSLFGLLSIHRHPTVRCQCTCRSSVKDGKGRRAAVCHQGCLPRVLQRGRMLEGAPPLALVTAEASTHLQFCAFCAFSSPCPISKSRFSELQR